MNPHEEGDMKGRRSNSERAAATARTADQQKEEAKKKQHAKRLNSVSKTTRNNDDGRAESRRPCEEKSDPENESTPKHATASNELVLPRCTTSGASACCLSASSSSIPHRGHKAKCNLVKESKTEQETISNDLVLPDTTHSSAGADAAGPLSTTICTQHPIIAITKKTKKLKQNLMPTVAAPAAGTVGVSENKMQREPDTHCGRQSNYDDGNGEQDVEAQNRMTPSSSPNGATSTNNATGREAVVGAFAVCGGEMVRREADACTLVSELESSPVDHHHANHIQPQSDNSGSAGLPEAEVAQPTEDLRHAQTRINELEERIQTYEEQEQQRTLVPVAQGEEIAIVAQVENCNINYNLQPRSINERTNNNDNNESAVKDTCVLKRRNRRFIAYGVVAALVVSVVVSVTIRLTTKTSSQSVSSSSSAPDQSPSEAPTSTMSPTQRSSWLPLGQELGGKAVSDNFGTSVSLSRDTRVMAIGAHQHNTGKPGSVSVFELDDLTGSWMPMGQELIGEANDDAFGVSVDMNGDGTILAVGAPLNNGNAMDAGHVRVFGHDISTNRWNQLGMDIDGEIENRLRGLSLSLSKDGDILAVGSPYTPGLILSPAWPGSENTRGSVRVFQYDGDSDSWEPLGQKLFGEAANDLFGFSVDLSSSGTIVAIGAIHNDLGGNNAGQVLLYQYNSTSSLWDRMGSPINGQVDYGQCGSSVSLDDSGMVVAVGAPGRRDVGNFTDARVSVFAYNSITSEWTRRGQTLESQERGNQFGWSVSLSGDGNVLAAGSYLHDANGLIDSGQVAIFQYNANTMEWDTVGDGLNGKASGDKFGDSVSLSNNGTIVAVGAVGRYFNGKENAGSASVYTLN